MAYAAVNLTGFMPSSSRLARVRYVATNTHILTLSVLNLSYDNVGTNIIKVTRNLLNSIGSFSTERDEFELSILGNLTNSLYYAFSVNTGGQSVSVYIKGWQLNYKM